MTKVLIVSGSPARISRTSALASFIHKELSGKGHEVEHLSLRDLPAEALVHAQFNDPSIQAAQSLVEQAEALIVLSPVYKASYPGILKSFFDLIPEKGLEGKKVLPIATGGTIAHLLSLEYSFKPLFSVLGAREIPQGVYIVDSQLRYLENEITFIEEDIKLRIQSAIDDVSGNHPEKIKSR